MAWLVISLLTKEKISSILASIISISSELLITLFLSSPLYVFKMISLSLSINDFRANPYCLFNLSASSSEMFNTTAISLVMLSPPSGMVFVYIKDSPSNTPISVFPAPISNTITLSCNSFTSKIKFLSAKVFGTIPSVSSPAFLRTVEICLVYSLSAKMICAFKVNSDDKFPTGSLVLVPSFKINSFGTISIIVFPSGTSMSLTCIMACPTSRTEIPAYLSFNSFVTLFCTMVAYFPGMVTYAELILNLASSSAFSIVSNS